MKNLLLVILMIMAPFTASAVACYSAGGNPATPNSNCTIDCSNPNTQLNNGLQQCGYINQPNPNPSTDTCYDYYNPNYNSYFPANGIVVNNCQTLPAAPINSGLIFLIIAGMFAGGFMLYKSEQKTGIKTIT